MICDAMRYNAMRCYTRKQARSGNSINTVSNDNNDMNMNMNNHSDSDNQLYVHAYICIHIMLYSTSLY